MDTEKKKKKGPGAGQAKSWSSSDIDPETVDKSHSIVSVISNDCGVRQTWVQILPLPFLDMGLVTESLHISGPRSVQWGQ